jgi:hypothetical protein
VALQITGGYFQVIDFLNRLSTLPRILVLDTLNVTADQNAKLTVAIASRMFVRQVPAGFAGAKPTSTTSSTASGGATTTTVAGATTTTARTG